MSDTLGSTATSPSHYRRRTNLDGEWHATLDPDNRGLSARWFDATIVDGLSERQRVRVPSCLEEVWPGYDGVVWYWKTFDLDRTSSGDPLTGRVHLCFGAVNYLAEVWLNGAFLGRHEGGTFFRLDASDAVRDGTNFLAVRVVDPGPKPVDGIRWPEVPAGREGTWFYNYGGIWQSVWLEHHAAAWIEDLFVRPSSTLDSLVTQVFIRNDADQPRALRVRLMVHDADNALVAGSEWVSTVVPGSHQVEESIRLLSPRRWSLNDPYLYRVTAELAEETPPTTVRDALSTRTGLRHFTFDAEDGVFRLNGEPVYIKGYLYNGYYAQTLAYPPEPARDFARQEVERVKRTGANLIRAFCKPLIPELLDACDELGLLVIEESEAGWYLGLSERMEEHFAREVTELVKRDRNHPCVVAWGTINEHAVFSLYAFARDVVQPRIWNELDPSRMILESPVIATPPDNEWLPAKGDLPAGRWAGFHQVHPYLGGPMVKEVFDRFKTLGRPGTSSITEAPQGSAPSATDPVPTLVSEFGSGGTPNFPAIIAEYRRRGIAEEAEDHAFNLGVLRRLEAGFDIYSLASDFGDLETLLRTAQEEQATRVRRQIEGMRSNPNVVGYILTAFDDEGWEMNGVFDTWRQPKAAVRMLEQTNAPRLCVIDTSRRTAYRGSEVGVEVHVVDELRTERSESTTVNGVVWLEDAQGRRVWETQAQAPLRGRATSILTTGVSVDGPTGGYTLRAEIEGFPPAEAPLYVVDPSRLSPVVPCVVWEELGEDVSSLLARRGGDVHSFSTASNPPATTPILVVNFETMTTNFSAKYRHFLRLVSEHGCTGIFVDTRSVPLPARFLPARWTYTVKEVRTEWWSSCHYVKAHPIFDGLPGPHVMTGYDEYSYICPRRTMIWHDSLAGQVGQPIRPRPLIEWPAGAEAVAGTFQTGLFGGHESGTWGVDLAVLPYGKGRLVISTFEIVEHLWSDPVAEVLLRNLLRFGAGSPASDSQDASSR